MIMDTLILWVLSVRIFQSSGLRSAPFVSVDLTIPDHTCIEVWRKLFLEIMVPALGLLWKFASGESVALFKRPLRGLRGHEPPRFYFQADFGVNP